MTDSLFERRPANRVEAEELIGEIRRHLAARGLSHRAPPPVPDACCGRGCNGCVWQGYFEALQRWQRDAGQLVVGG